MIRRICYHNAAEYLCLPMVHKPVEIASAAAPNGHGLPVRGAERVRVQQMEKES
jgi:hypothetical protein